MEEKCNIPLYSTSGLMHIVRYVFIRKTYGRSRQAVVLGCFSFVNCQAVTCEPRDFSPHSTTFMWVLNFFLFVFFLLPKNASFKKGWKMCETQFKALSITLTWPMLPSTERFLSLKEPKKNPWPSKSFQYNDSAELTLTLTTVQLFHTSSKAHGALFTFTV